MYKDKEIRTNVALAAEEMRKEEFNTGDKVRIIKGEPSVPETKNYVGKDGVIVEYISLVGYALVRCNQSNLYFGKECLRRIDELQEKQEDIE
jgi:ribosomal protein L21E